MKRARASERELMAQWRRGDMQAAVTLLQLHRPALERFLARRAPDAADDLLQDTYLVVMGAGARFRGQSAFRTFAFGVARSLLRRSWQEQRHPSIDEPECLIAATPSSFAIVAHEQARALLDRAVAGLPEELRAATRLAMTTDNSPAEIAGLLGVSLSTVATRLQRAKQRLRAELAPALG